MAVSAAVAWRRGPGADCEIHWVMTAAWTYPDSRWRQRILTPLTRWAFERVARVYGFVTMPPMPPDPEKVGARARSVLRTVRLARRLVHSAGMLGLAPEGADTPGRLGVPPEGAGEFIALLVKEGFPVLPVGVQERAGSLTVSFGPPFAPDVSKGRDVRDRLVAGQVMEAIARLVS
jgi:hypothetical protein